MNDADLCERVPYSGPQFITLSNKYQRCDSGNNRGSIKALHKLTPDTSLYRVKSPRLRRVVIEITSGTEIGSWKLMMTFKSMLWCGWNEGLLCCRGCVAFRLRWHHDSRMSLLLYRRRHWYLLLPLAPDSRLKTDSHFWHNIITEYKLTLFTTESVSNNIETLFIGSPCDCLVWDVKE